MVLGLYPFAILRMRITGGSASTSRSQLGQLLQGNTIMNYSFAISNHDVYISLSVVDFNQPNR